MTVLLKGGLKQMMLCCRFLFVWLLLVLLNFSLKSVYPLSVRAFSYVYLDELKSSSLEEFLDKRSLIIVGNWMMICGGWFEDLLIYNNKSLGFLFGQYVPLFKVNEVSKKVIALAIDAETNLKIIDFLDTTFNLNNDTYRPYKKPNDLLLYINKSSNYPPQIINQLPKIINKCLSRNSSNEYVFNSSFHMKKSLETVDTPILN